MKQRYRLEIIYDGACPMCIRTVQILKWLDWLGMLEYRDLTEWDELKKKHPSLDWDRCLQEMHVVSTNGDIETGFFGFRKICSRVLPGWLILPVLYLPPIPYMGQWIYKKIASKRKRTGLRCTRHVCSG